ncbi:MAG: hypothetical protein GXX90_07955 [Microbacteriaceae bacterium]|nr:hypothetical protein [Microbacteriaceae bacterium]
MSDPVSLRIPVLASAVEVRGLDEAQARELERVWRRCGPVRVTPIDADAPRDAAVVIDRRALPALDERAFGEHLVGTATLAAIESRAGERLLLHGAALAEPSTGATIALVGPSGAGKTTATRELGRRLAYLTDETVSIGADLDVERFEKPLSRLVDGRRPKRQHAPDELGLRPGVDGARLAVIAVLARDPGAEGAPEARRLPIVEALAALAPQTSSLARLPRGLVRLCATIDACGGAVELRYAEASSLPPLVDELLAGRVPAGPVGRWRAVDAEALGLGASEPAGDAARYRRGEVGDAVELDEGLAVLGHRGLTVVAGLAPTVLAAASEWRTRAELVDAVRREFGAHPDADRLVDETLAALVEHRLLERRDGVVH